MNSPEHENTTRTSSPGSESTADKFDEGAPASPLDQLLICYLDGELDEKAVAELESRLTTDADLRNRLHQFQRTWDMLDEVTTTKPEAEFVQSTIEMVVSSARKRRAKWHRWPLRIAVALIAFAIPAIVAWQSARWFQFQPWRQFVAELQFWENVDMYDQVESIEFLERLNTEGLFAEELTDEH